jgi:hypothetical protein
MHGFHVRQRERGTMRRAAMTETTTMKRTTRILQWTALGALAMVLCTASLASATTSKEFINCQKQFENQLRGFTNMVYLRLYGCAEKVVECKLAQEIDGVDPTACLARASKGCAAAPGKIDDQAATREGRVVQRCGLIALADLEQFDAGLGFYNVVASCSAASINDLVDCVFANGRCAAEKELFLLDPRAQDSLTTAGVAASFPCVGP